MQIRRQKGAAIALLAMSVEVNEGLSEHIYPDDSGSPIKLRLCGQLQNILGPRSSGLYSNQNGKTRLRVSRTNTYSKVG